MNHHAPPDPAIDIHEDVGWTVVEIRGVIDRGTAPLVRRRLLGAARRTSGGLVVDLAGATFLDCRGMAALAAARDVLPPGHELRLRGAWGIVARALALSDLYGALEEDQGRALLTSVTR